MLNQTQMTDHTSHIFSESRSFLYPSSQCSQCLKFTQCKKVSFEHKSYVHFSNGNSNIWKMNKRNRKYTMLDETCLVIFKHCVNTVGYTVVHMHATLSSNKCSWKLTLKYIINKVSNTIVMEKKWTRNFWNVFSRYAHILQEIHVL